MTHAHADCLDRARQMHLVYHPRRSAKEVAQLIPLVRSRLPREGLPEPHPGWPKVLRVPGDALRAVLAKDHTRGFELLEPLFTNVELVKLVFELDQRHSCVWVPKPGGRMLPGEFEILHLDQATEMNFADAKQYRDEVALALARPKDRSKRAHQRFFADLDLKTNVEFLDLTPYSASTRLEVKRWVGQVMRVLRRRLPERAVGADHRPRLNGMMDELDRLAGHFLSILLAEYGSVAPTGAGSWEEGIELFAIGQLRMQLEPSLAWAWQPNSSAYFLFGEFALSACELLERRRLTDPKWTWDFALRLANVTVRTQPLYAEVYGNRARAAAEPGPDDYRAFDFDEKRASRARDELVKARTDFRDATFEELCSHSAEHLTRFVPGWSRSLVPN